MANLKAKKDFTEGPLFGRMFLYSVPIILSGLLQMCYNIADHVVLGKFSGDATALAAVGSTASLSNLIIGFLLGIAGGTAVVVAQFYGARRNDQVSLAVHTSITVSIIGGIAVMLIALVAAEPLLLLMNTKEDIIDQAILYLMITAIGFPALSIMNFGAGIIRSTGDSKTPLIIFSLSGIINVLFNLFFVAVFHMKVEGVAIATVISQYASAIAILTVLKRRKSEPYALSLRRLRIDKNILLRILRFGVPAGIQSCLFSISNVFFTTSVNQFDTITVTAKTIEGNVDNITYITMNSYFHVSMTFVGQNYGAKKINRIRRVILYSLMQVAIIGISVSLIEMAFAPQLCAMFMDPKDANFDAILVEAVKMIKIVLATYFMCGIMEVLAGSIRGLGYSFSPMFTSIFSICVLRILRMTVLFNKVEWFHSVKGLLLSYPFTWAVCIAAYAVILIIALIRLRRLLKPKATNLEEIKT
jgi:putative MATE family efflux protein